MFDDNRPTLSGVHVSHEGRQVSTFHDRAGKAVSTELHDGQIHECRAQGQGS